MYDDNESDADSDYNVTELKSVTYSTLGGEGDENSGYSFAAHGGTEEIAEDDDEEMEIDDEEEESYLPDEDDTDTAEVEGSLVQNEEMTAKHEEEFRDATAQFLGGNLFHDPRQCIYLQPVTNCYFIFQIR